MSLVFDEFGRPFIILREQEQKSRLTGIQAQKVCICTLKIVPHHSGKSGCKNVAYLSWTKRFYIAVN